MVVFVFSMNQADPSRWQHYTTADLQVTTTLFTGVSSCWRNGLPITKSGSDHFRSTYNAIIFISISYIIYQSYIYISYHYHILILNYIYIFIWFPKGRPVHLICSPILHAECPANADQDITREVLALEPRGSHRQHRRVPMDFPQLGAVIGTWLEHDGKFVGNTIYIIQYNYKYNACNII